MPNQSRQLVILIMGALLIGLASQYGHNVQAAPELAPDDAPANQTVPFPTFTPENTPVPTATPSNDNEDDDAEPTPSPTPTDISDAGEPGDSEDTDSEDEGSDDESEGDSDAPATEDSNDDAGQDGGNAESPSDSAGETADAPTAIVSPIVLNVRAGPGVSNAVLGTLFQDDSIKVLGRSGTWWLVCCPLGSNTPGWVDSQFLTPDFDVAEVDELVPTVSGVDGAGGDNSAGNSAVSSSAVNDSLLEFQISHDPEFVWQGQPFEMTFTVTNTASSTAEDVRIRNDFPTELTFLEEVDAANAEIQISTSDSGSTILVAEWPELPAGDSLSLTVALTIDSAIEFGSVIDNLAVVTAANADDVTSGISIGMPPASLPSFR